ncbi:MAG: hypothetical protein HC803_08610 [Saprospiraceae bacterium]|nr:hypothetical protein [Saprospiraceae bacterium]
MAKRYFEKKKIYKFTNPKNIIDRFENVKSAFEISKPQLIQNKHVLIVDDVITTGATLEACAINCLEVADCKISFATIAFAVH